MSYSEKVLEYNKKTEHVGKLDETASNVGTGWVGAPSCGDVMRLQIEVGEGEVIKDVKFKTYGCGSAIAASALAGEMLKGRSIQEALQVRNNVIADQLQLPPIKRHCSLLAEDAIKMAIKDYISKRDSRGDT